MQIRSIDLYLVALPLKRRLPGPAGVEERLETVLVRLGAGDAFGWGEASPGTAPRTGSEWAGGSLAVLKNWLGPAVLGATLEKSQPPGDKLTAWRGNQHAKAALDMAWWDLLARRADKPLHQFIGGAVSQVEVGASLDQMDSPEEFMRAVDEVAGAGFSRIKFKFRPGWELNMLSAVHRELAGPTLHVDCEGQLTLGQTDILYRLDDFHLSMVEQPLADYDLVAHAMLQESIRTPICLDESITLLEHAEIAVDLKSCQFFNLKPGRVGGLSAALRLHDFTHEHCTPCFAGAAPQSAIGARHYLALGTRPNCTYAADYFPADRYLADDVAPPLLPARSETDGRQYITLDSSAGIGVEPDVAALERLTIEHVRIG
ncbi:MAG: enolase C-terminal domain-like protein [Planctomycetota bacterium]